MSDTETRRLRIVDDHQHDALTRFDPPQNPGSTTRVATTSGTGYANAFVAVTFAAVTGTETAGTAGTVTGADAGFAFNLGTTAPSSGTNVVCHYCDYRWVFRFD